MHTRALITLFVFLLAACGSDKRLAPLSNEDVILAFGDSLTHGTGVNAHQSYPSVLSELSGLEVIRSGVPGEISKDGKARLKSELERHDPDLVILCHGGNDVLRRLPMRATEQNLRSMITMSRESGAQVVVIAVPRFGLFPEPIAFYERIAGDMNVPVELDILADLEGDNSMKSDSVHFNSAGYRKMAEAVHELLIDTGAL